MQTDIGIISATITTPIALIKIAAQEGTSLSTNMGKASKATAFVISKVLKRVWWD